MLNWDKIDQLPTLNDEEVFNQFEKDSYINLHESERRSRLRYHLSRNKQELRELENIRVFETDDKGKYIKQKYTPKVMDTRLESHFTHTLPNSISAEHYLLRFKMTVRATSNNILNKPIHEYVIQFQGERVYE